MSIRRSRGSKAAIWDNSESFHERVPSTDGHRPSRRGPSGLIFMCNSKTKRDCFHYKVLGLPLAKRDLVEQVVPGVFLFLFDIDLRELHGIFEASSYGGLNLEPQAFQGQGLYPAQVRFIVYRDCLPLPENIFKGAIQENYYAWNKFHHELSSNQVSKLMQLFSPIDAPRKRLRVDSVSGAMQGPRLHIPGGLESANRMPQYRLAAPGIRLEERLPRHLGGDTGPMAVDAGERHPLPQMRVPEGRRLLPLMRVPEESSDQTDLLTQGQLEEVDQLALKYLQQGNPTAGRALNPPHRDAVVEGPRAIPLSLQQEAIRRSRAVEAERLRRTAAEQVFLREQGSSFPRAGSSRADGPFVPARRQPVAMSGLPRRIADIPRRR